MKYLTYLALMASVDAKWTPLKDLKKWHKSHPHPFKEFQKHHKHDLQDASKWLKKEWKEITTPEQVKLDRIKLEKIVGGVLRGALDAEGFDDVNKCIQDAEHVFTDADNAYKDFKAGGASNVINGMKELADLFKQVKAGMSDCSHLKADWKKLETMVEIFDSPTSFAYHVGKDLIVNGHDIFHEIQTAVTDYQAENWEDFGYQVGEAAAKTIIGEKPVENTPGAPSVKSAKMLQGVIAAYGGHFNLDALLACIGDEDKGLLILDAAFQEFQQAVAKKDVQDLIGGVIATVAGLMQMKQGLPACEAIDTTSWDYNGFSRSEQIMKNPVAFFKPVAEDVLIHGIPILKETHDAVEAYNNQDYYDYGLNVGKILANATGVRSQFQAEGKLENVDREMAAKVASGLLSATQVGSFNFQDLLICIYEADQSAEILEAAVETLEDAYKKHDWNEAVGGVIASVAFVQQLKQTIPVCESVDSKSMNWTQFDKIIDTIEDPVNHIDVIEKDIKMNGKVITKDIERAVEAFRAGKYVEYGQMLGNTFYYATEDEQNLFLF